ANPGDRLLLEGGVTFSERITLAEGVTLQGGYAGCGSGSSSRTTINGAGGSGGSVVRITAPAAQAAALTMVNLTGGRGVGGGIYLGPNASPLTLQYVGIYSNTGTPSGGGMYVSVNAVVTGTAVTIHDNSATDGGGLRLYGGRATFTSSTIYANAADRGAGVFVGYTAQADLAPALNLTSADVVHGNTALTGVGFGGGIYVEGGQVTVSGYSDVHSNDAVVGGGVYMVPYDGDTIWVRSLLTVTGDGVLISHNTATQSGGGIYARDGTVNLFDRARLVDNTATVNGGGAFLDHSNLYADSAAIADNTAGGDGGGVCATIGSLLDMDPGTTPCSSPRCSELSRNTAGIQGGGVKAIGSSVDLEQTTVEDNTAATGGGIFVSTAAVYLTNVVVAHNDATSGSGDGIHLASGGTLSGAHVTIGYNDAGGASTGVGVTVATGGDLTLSNAIVWGHETSISSLTESVTCSDIQMPDTAYPGTGNLDLTPLFVSSSTGDFRLRLAGPMGLPSPCIDKCATGAARDFENQPRPAVFFRPTTPYDMGADEAWRGTYLPLVTR
ncbi:MAG: hypothetical protein MUF84_19400, partial [Anaerolineae bacterium]|nr:hypothetical protein [Anaerolineae bacterium]